MDLDLPQSASVGNVGGHLPDGERLRHKAGLSRTPAARGMPIGLMDNGHMIVFFIGDHNIQSRHVGIQTHHIKYHAACSPDYGVDNGNSPQNNYRSGGGILEFL